MMSTKQKWTLGGLIALSGGIWTPQLIQRFGADTQAQVGFDDGPVEDEMLLIESQSSGSMGQPMEAGGMAGPLGMTQAGSGAGTASTTRAGGPEALLTEVLSALSVTEAFGVTEEATRIVEDVTPSPVAAPVVVPGESLRDYVQKHPLRGTIAGETIQVALVGSYRVHVGDVLPGTDARVTRIARGTVTVANEEVELDLVLDPLRTSAQQMRERARSQDNSGGDASELVPGVDNSSASLDSFEPDAVMPAGNSASNAAAPAPEGDN